MSDRGWKAASQVTFIGLNSARQGVTTVLYVQDSTRQPLRGLIWVEPYGKRRLVQPSELRASGISVAKSLI